MEGAEPLSAAATPFGRYQNFAREICMLKFAIICLVISLVAGALGFTNVSVIAKRIAITLFVLFFLAFLALIGIAVMVGEAIFR
jgi:uncharacterized membrane protein YtjA (UPF0391 family)